MKRYKISDDWTNTSITVDVEETEEVEEVCKEINNFWSNSEDRLRAADGNVVHATLKLLMRNVILWLLNMGAVFKVSSVDFKTTKDGVKLMVAGVLN